MARANAHLWRKVDSAGCTLLISKSSSRAHMTCRQAEASYGHAPSSRGPSSPLRSRPAVLLCFSHFLIGYLRSAFVCRPCRLNGEAFPLSLRSFCLLRTSGCFRFCSNLAADGIMNSLDLRWCLHHRPGNTPYGSVPDLLYTYLSVRPRLPSSSAERRGYPCPSQ